MFWNNLIELCAKKDITPSGLAKELSIASGAVTKWKNGSTPHQTTLLKIANYFNVSVDYLLKDTPQGTTPGLDEKDIEILVKLSRLSGEYKKEALSYLDFLEQRKASQENQ